MIPRGGFPNPPRIAYATIHPGNCLYNLAEHGVIRDHPDDRAARRDLEKIAQDNQVGHGPFAELATSLVQVRRRQETPVASSDGHSISGRAGEAGWGATRRQERWRRDRATEALAASEKALKPDSAATYGSRGCLSVLECNGPIRKKDHTIQFTIFGDDFERLRSAASSVTRVWELHGVRTGGRYEAPDRETTTPLWSLNARPSSSPSNAADSKFAFATRLLPTAMWSTECLERSWPARA